MFPLRCLRTRPVGALLIRRCLIRTSLIRGCALSLSLTLAACASDEEHRREAYGQHPGTTGDHYQRGSANPSHQSAMVAGAANQTGHPAHKSRQPDVEDDGLPSQVPPPRNRKHEADDPSEPFSPNYGNPNARRAPSAQHPPARQAGTRAPAVAGWQHSAR